MKWKQVYLIFMYMYSGIEECDEGKKEESDWIGEGSIQKKESGNEQAELKLEKKKKINQR